MRVIIGVAGSLADPDAEALAAVAEPLTEAGGVESTKSAFLALLLIGATSSLMPLLREELWGRWTSLWGR